MTSTTPWTARLLHPDQVDEGDRALILRNLASRMTDLILDLESRDYPLDPWLSQTVLVQMVRPWVHPLLTDQVVLDLLVGLSASVSMQAEYLTWGTWDPEQHEVMDARSHEERMVFLQADVDRATKRLITALEPVR